MLEPTKFAGNQAVKIVDRFWDEVLKPLIAQRLDARSNGEPRSKKKFKLDKERVILFRDTEACLLDRNSYALRERIILRNGEEDKSTREAHFEIPYAGYLSRRRDRIDRKQRRPQARSSKRTFLLSSSEARIRQTVM